MKKNTFIEGAFIATLGIVICKIIGLLYVIPFYGLIGSQGGALYSYAYSIYAIFLSLSNSGIPVAVSKIVSEYNALGYVKAKETAFKIASTLIIFMGFFFFIVLIIFAPNIAHVIIGNIEGGNTLEGVTLVIRIVATALLIVPIESVTQGYFQGHKIMFPPSMANVIEQLFRVIVIVAGSYVALEVFHSSLETAVGIAVFGATIGCLVAYFYLLRVLHKKKDQIKEIANVNPDEPTISKKEILKKIVAYALPFIIIDLMRSGYGIIDSLTVVKSMVNLGYSVQVAESSIGVLATWGTKLNMIVASIALGITTSLIPNLVSSYTKGNLKAVNRKINQSFEAIMYIALPMVLGLSFLGQPVWNVFYGYDPLCIKIIRVYVLQSFIFCIYSISLNTAQSLNNSKIALSGLFGSFLCKALFNIPIMYLMVKIGSEAYYGPIVANIIIQGGVSLIMLYALKKKHGFNYGRIFKTMGKIIFSLLIMLIILFGLNFIFPVNVTDRTLSLFVIIIYTIVGAITYIVTSHKTGLIKDVFGEELVNKVLIKLHLRKA